MKRLAITLEQMAARPNLLLAVHKAARGKQQRPAVARWLAGLEPHLAALAGSILDQTAPRGEMRRFTIHDPKQREISAACFDDRVLHHAILNLAEPRFEQMLVPGSFACRPGLGVHAAVQAVRTHLQRHAWWVQVDVQGCFAAIDHAVLKSLLARRFKGQGLLDLFGRIIDTGAAPGSGRGLPIGALTSQHFANAYLDGVDRWLLARPEVRAVVRYMDDIVWWCDGRREAEATLAQFRAWLAAELKLVLRATAPMGPSARGLAFCGFRVKPGVVLPSARKLRRFRQAARAQARALAARQVSEAQAQRAHDVLAGTLAHTQSLRFRLAVWEGVLARSGYSEAL